jgi:hypothetical protein
VTSCSYGYRLRWAALVFLLVSCGGGSGVSSEFPSSLRGTVVSADGSPVSGVRVSIESTGDSELTDVSGTFFIQTEFSSGEIVLLLETQGMSGRVSIGSIPRPAAVSVQLEVSFEGGGLRIEILDLAVAVP